jgi:hypothetical protein
VGSPGSDEVTEWTQAASLEFSAASLTCSVDIGEGWMVHGSVKVDGSDELSLIPVPFSVSGNVEATFTFNNGCMLQLKAQSARLALTGEASFVEAFPGV